MTNATATNALNGTAPAPVPPRPNPAATEWLAGFCNDYAPTLFDLGWWFVLAALIGGVLLAAVHVYRAATAPAPPPPGDEAGGAVGLPALAGALKELVEVFTKAPAWLALFGAGILLLWMAGNAAPDECLGRAGGQPAPKEESRPRPKQEPGADAERSAPANANANAGTPPSAEVGGSGAAGR
jgi:hypothetical protein